MLAWWTCKDCGGEYQAWITSRLAGSKCPYCSNRAVKAGINDLATTDPDIASEWLYEMNGTDTPQSVTRTSCRVYWWKSGCGHEWKAKVSDRTIARIPCTKCEAEFRSILTKLLIVLYAARNCERILFHSDSAIGYPLEMYIPGLFVAIEKESRSPSQQQEQSLKRFICSRNEIFYYTYQQPESAEEAVKEARLLFRKMDIYISSDLQEDIRQARKMYEKLRQSRH